MNRKILCSLLVLSLIPLLATETATAGIQHFAWVNSSVGEDLYYHQNVVAYKTGTWWNISISVYNDYLTPPPPPRIYLPVNITAIKVYFDWGAWYNYTFTTPVRMEPLEVKVFNVGNVTPPLTVAPETWVHSYTVYAEYIVEGETTPRMDWYWSGDNFAVMSETHFNSFQLYNKLKNIMTGITILPSAINVTEAQVLFVKAYTEYTLGKQYYSNGDFENAKTYFQNADLYYTEALTAWSERGTTFEDTMLDYYDSLAKAQIIQANAALNNSYGWIFFGIGWILIGVGIIVYGARKPKAS
jgi:tetratricopeptide (TPR) repeat protein